VLDVGCGGGQLLAAAQRVTVSGRSSPHAALAGALGSSRAVAGCAGRPAFDGVVMSHALEHVPDLRATLAGLLAALADDGWLCLEVPNLASLRARLSVPALVARGADERHRAFPIHLYYFTPRTLARALADVGLAVRAQATSGLGLGALRPRRGAAADDDAPAPPTGGPAAPRAPRGLYAAAKGFHRALLGENLMVVATARG
jgi:SAM-dependent methyltransferase